MKHIIITLSIHQWGEILAGRQLFALHKSIPRIHPFSSRVYVVIKGTSIVPGYFTLSGIVGSDDADYLWEYCAGNLGINIGKYHVYASEMKECLYAWEIDSVYRYDFPVDIKHNFGIANNPPTHIYTEIEPVMQALRIRGDQLTQSFFSRNFVMPISLYYRGSWYDNIPEKINDESEPEKAVQ